MRIISLSKYNAHTEPIFKQLQLLKNLSHYFQMLPLNPNLEIHNCNTRHNEYIHLRRANHKFAQMCIRHNVPILINTSDQAIKDKFHTKFTMFCQVCENQVCPNVGRYLRNQKLLYL